MGYLYNAKTVEIVRPATQSVSNTTGTPLELIVDGQHIPLHDMRGEDVELQENPEGVLIPVFIWTPHLVRRVKGQEESEQQHVPWVNQASALLSKQ